jgi:hypothetical protein
VPTLLLALWLPLVAMSAPSPARLAFAPVCHGGRVAVDRLDVGHLPISPVSVAPGFHVVEVMCPGRSRWLRLVFVDAGEVRELRAEIAPRPSPVVTDAEGPPGAAVDSPPRFEISGRVGLDARSGPGAADDAASVTQSWALAYGSARRDGWRASFVPSARHGLTAANAGTQWQVHELRLRSDRHAGWALGGGRFTDVVPGEAPERVDGGRVDWSRGAWRVAVTGQRTAEGDDTDGVLVGGFSGQTAWAEARATAGTRGARCAATAGVGGLEGWHGSAQGAIDGDEAVWARAGAGHVGESVDAEVGGQWRPDALDDTVWLLDAPGGLLVAPEGLMVAARLVARDGPTRVEVDGRAGPAGHRLAGRASVAHARVTPFVDAASVSTAGARGLRRWDRLGGGIDARPGTRWRIDVRLGPDRLVATVGDGLQRARTLWSGSARAGFALDPAVWLRASVTTGPRNPQDDVGPGRAAVGFIGLEVW